MRPNISIMILNHNRLEDVSNSLNYIRRLLHDRDDIEVIVVDNASTDGSRAYLENNRHWIKVVQLEVNEGIAGLNEGFEIAHGEYILVLDDDSHPLDELTFSYLIACFKNKSDVGVVAFRIENKDGVRFKTWHLPEKDVPGPSLAFVGCGFAIRRDLFKQIGWYPARFFIYQNEIEVAIRVMKLQYKIHYEPNCRVVHHESKNGRGGWRQVYFPTRNTIWIIRKYFPFPSAGYLIMSRLIMGLIRAIQFGEIGWYLRAISDAFSESIDQDRLPQAILCQLKAFWKQNSIYHHLKERVYLLQAKLEFRPFGRQRRTQLRTLERLYRRSTQRPRANGGEGR